MKKYDNFLDSLNNLRDIYDYDEPYGNVELTGMVGLFEVCFEQAWKAIKEILTFNGYDECASGSPRRIIKTAFACEMIKDEELWLDALISRNNVAHSYNKAIASDIIRKTKECYYNMFLELKITIEEGDWL